MCSRYQRTEEAGSKQIFNTAKQGNNNNETMYGIAKKHEWFYNLQTFQNKIIIIHLVRFINVHIL